MYNYVNKFLQCEPSISNIYLICFSIFELFIVLSLINIYIRSPMNNFIISIQNLNTIYIIIILLFFNVALSFIVFNLFKWLKKKFFPYYLCIIDEIIIYYERHPLVVELNLGYVYMNSILGSTGKTTYNGAEKYRLAKQFIVQGARDLKMANQFSKQSRLLNNMAPLMDRSGNGSLYDSFTESARTFKNKAETYEESARFFWAQANFLCHEAGYIVPFSQRGASMLARFTGYSL